MTDQIYYKIQYPLKKAINIIKEVEEEDPFAGKNSGDFSQEEINEIREFLEIWQNKGKESIKNLINKLRKLM
jgi:phosphoenolpyruvate carboxylase